MSSVETAAPAVEGAHTVFLMTNFWESMSEEVEIGQGKAVADACKKAGVKHLIFSSLINTKEASKGKLSNITHFDGKNAIERYIRASGVPCSFVQPGFFMSQMTTMIRKNEDGGYMWALPVDGDKAQVPMFAAELDTGKFVVAAVKKDATGTGQCIRAASDYYSPNRIMSEFSEAIGKPAFFVQIPAETFKSFLPPPVAQELLENMLLLEEPGYYAGARLSLDLLDEQPKPWKTYVEENKEKWLSA